MLLTNIIPQKHSQFSYNLEGRDFIIGDLHGQINYLNKAFDIINFDKTKDRIFSVGDLIDRGSSSKEIIDLVNEDWIHPVYGNHEQLLIQCFDNDILQKQKWFPRGGAWWENLMDKEKFEVKTKIIQNYSLSIELETKNGIISIVHADIPANLDWPDIRSNHSLSEKEVHTLLWSRDTIRKKSDRFIKGTNFLFMGHTPVKSPLILGNCIYIDTGSGYPASNNIPNPCLTIAEVLPHYFHFIQVNHKGIFNESKLYI